MLIWFRFMFCFCWVRIKQFLPVASALLIGGVTVTSFTIHQGKERLFNFYMMTIGVGVVWFDIVWYINNSGKKHAAVSGVGFVGRSDCRSGGDDQGQWKALVFKASSLPSHLIPFFLYIRRDSVSTTFFFFFISFVSMLNVVQTSNNN